MEKPAETPKQIGAFFDVDKTLISENSGTLYLKHRYQQGESTAWEVLGGLGSYLRYKAGCLDLQAWMEEAVSVLQGESELELEREVEKWFRSSVLETIYPESVELVRSHQAKGHVVALVSATTKFVVRPLAEYLGIKNILYTRLETRKGRFTGKVIQPICYGEGKVTWMRKFIEEENIDLARSYFYTDSITDQPLLELVGHPVAINPDFLLYRMAKRRCWPVRLFASPKR